MAERKLRITNYRNVGVLEKQELLLNTSVEKGEIGNLVLVVGPNNCGKSNTLDALISFGTKNGITVKDIPDFNNDNPAPELSLVITDNDKTLGFDKTFSNQTNEEGKYFYKNKNPKQVKERVQSKEAIDFVLGMVTFNIKNLQLSRVPAAFHQRANEITVQRKVTAKDYELLKAFHYANNNIWGPNYYRNFYSPRIDEATALGYIDEFNVDSIIVNVLDWEKDNELKVIPNIIKFAETVTSHSQLTVNPNNLMDSPFFRVLFSAIDYPLEALVSCYKKVREQGLNGLLKKTAGDINIKLNEVTKQFNKLFFLNDKKYKFEIVLETNLIYLSIFMDEIPLHLDKQSAGFRWFFNFYFSVIAKTNLNRGDIIVMDEPATNLHMQGIQELRSFMKDFAKRTELTFVVSTHIPFFVDVNYLEEVRIVTREGDGAVIDNKFHAIGGQETDALKPIKDALTVGRYVLYDQTNTHTIFVEGISDYCYLTAFKIYHKIDNIVFLPIQGIKKNGIIDSLVKIEKYPTILVDADEAGIAFKEKNSKRKNVEIFTLADIDKSWKTIEDLFSAEDKQKTKNFTDCVAFKNKLSKSKISKETKANFKKLLENIAV